MSKVQLYKALLYFKTAEAVKSGTLNVEDSYRYRSLDDYLIPLADWGKRQGELLAEAGLTGVADFRAVLGKMEQELDEQYETTNRNILKGKNTHITFHKDGSYHVRTPRQEETDAEPLSSFFPQDRYVSLLEVLWTVNRHSRFLNAFQHWQTRYVKRRPPDELFFAGIIATAAKSASERLPGFHGRSAVRNWNKPSTGTFPPATSRRGTT